MGAEAYRYRGRASAFVLEAAGRPGAGAIACMRRFAAQAGDGYSTSVSHAWAGLSSVLHSWNAIIQLSAWGVAPLDRGLATLRLT